MGDIKGPKGTDWATCPKCWKKVKKSNLPKHLKKVHGVTRPGIAEPTKRKNATPFPIWNLAISAVITIIIVLIALIAADRYLMGPEGPSISVEPTTYNFGNIQPHTVSTTFNITNEGDAPLEIYNISTSCDCTQAVLTYNGQESPMFKMNDNPKYKVKISPGETAKLKVTYDPDMFMNSGPIYRDVRMNTNDNAHRSMVITITAFVVR